MPSKVSLQINLAPSDYKHASSILEHQLKILAEQVDEILLTIDTRASKGRFAEGWYENKNLLDNLLAGFQQKYSLKLLYVDYAKDVNKEIGNFFFRQGYVPEKDFRGGPFYSYFFGLYHAKNNYVFHVDSDIFFGGLSKSWITEAVRLLESDPSILVLSPLPGPPHPDQKLIKQTIVKKLDGDYAFELKGMSTRLFLIDKGKFEQNKIELKKPSLRNQAKAIVEGNANADLPEHLISDYMEAHSYKRIDFLGEKPGLWSLHPPFRTSEFYANLPDIINRIENDQLPPSQYGFYDVVDEVCDWSEAKMKIKNNRWWKRLLKK